MMSGDAVFGAAPPERRIPSTVADRASLETRPTVDAFVRLLDLPSGRFEVGPVLIRGELELYDLDDTDITMLSLGVAYQF